MIDGIRTLSAYDLLVPAASKRVLFIGETIHDVYHYGRAQGRPMKESIPCLQHAHTEEWRGGVHASAAHARALCAKVDVASWVAIRKERWIEEAHTRKLFEVYGPIERLESVRVPLVDYDRVCVNDYGHDMFDAATIKLICDQASFLALNVQTNSGNYGFNLATRWPRADYLCCQEFEARLATQNRSGPIETSLEALAKRATRIAVTRGAAGAIGMENGEITTQPALSRQVVDTMGAGDAFFAVTAALAGDLPMAELLRIGNAAGALKVGWIGHRMSVTKSALLELLNGTR